MKLLPGKRLRLLLPVLVGLAWFLRKRLAERREADLETLTIPPPVRPTQPRAPSPEPPPAPSPPLAPSAQPVASTPPVPPQPTPPRPTPAPAPAVVEDTVPSAADEPYGPGSARPLVDGSAPSPDYTIKGKTSSMLFHTPASPYYGRTKAEVWFRTEQDAITAGFTGWAPRSRVTRSG